MRLQRVRHNWVTFTFPLACIETFLTFCCLAIPTAGGALLTHQPHQRRILTEECDFPSDFLHLQPFHFIWRRAVGAWTVEIKPVNTKGNQPWIFIERTGAETEAPIFWAPDAKSRLIGKDPDAGKDWGQEVKGVTEDKIDGITNSVNMNLSKIWEIMKDREAWCATVNGISKNRTLLCNWTTATKKQERIRNYYIIQELFSHIRTFLRQLKGLIITYR